MEISGLTTRQVEICDQLWACNTCEDLYNYFKTLPDAEVEMAETLREIMMQEAAEEELSLMDRYPAAEEMLAILKKDFL